MSVELTVVLGVAGLALLGVQVWIMRRQTDILDRQTKLAAQQAEWRRVEAIGTFVRLAFDLAMEFENANGATVGRQIMADFKTHPRALLREAGRVFAPLGKPFVVAATQTAMWLDDYFDAVNEYNRDCRGAEGLRRLEVVQKMREQVGHGLDAANRAIPESERWRYDNGKDYDFHGLCSLPAAFLDAVDGASGARVK